MKKFAVVKVALPCAAFALGIGVLCASAVFADSPQPSWHAKLGWSAAPMQLDPGVAWQAEGEPEGGMDTYTLGATECFDGAASVPLDRTASVPLDRTASVPLDRTASVPLDADLRCTVYWGRFNPRSSLYQAAFGALSINNFALRVEWENPTLQSVRLSLERYIHLSVVSQNAWLRSFGLAQPVTFLEPQSVAINDQGNGVFRLEYKLSSESDMGDQIPADSPFYALAPPFSAVAKMVDPYHALELTFVAYLSYDAASDRLRAVHYNLASYTLKTGQAITPTDYAIQQLEAMAASVSWK